ncbi:MAG: cytochrome C [Betaproteobacteria bacterium SG8_39]|nr:MAG: cytochrome C [Betaproteobacteria bacterium SG8_39]
MKRLLVALLAAPLAALALHGGAQASEAGYRLDPAPIDPNDQVSLQSGVRTFVNYCLNCHGAQFMRYNRLQDIGLTDQQIKDKLLFTADKVGETMKIAMTTADGKAWFGVAPPDLTVIARARGADWLYTYLRTFYRDPKTPSGWNNAVFPNVGMPHALWTLQGERALKIEKVKDKAGHAHVEYHWSQLSKGEQSAIEYDRTVRDLVNFLVYLGEPAAESRKRIGVIVLFVLGILFVFAYVLKREFWKDVH